MSGGTGRTVLSASAATLVSRIIGFIRNISLAAALGTSLVSDSYNLANQVPNQIFLLLGGGTIAAVFLPQLARLAATSRRSADRYGTVLLIAAGLFGVFASLGMLLLAPHVVSLLGGSAWDMSQRDLTVALFMWCIPQIAAYAVFTVASQLMNSRGKFTLVSWLPSVSSISVIAGCMIVIANGALQPDQPSSVSPAIIVTLGATTLGGTAAQTVALLVLLARIGFRPNLRGGFRGLGLRTAVQTGTLTLASAMCYQLSNLFTAAWAAQAGSSASEDGFSGFGYSALFFATALISVVQGIAVASLASVLLQRMSKHFASGDDKSAFAELDNAILRLASFVIPAAMMLTAAAPAIGQVLFARGQTSISAARIIGVVLACLAIGLLPYTLHALLIRPFYARHDAVRPLLSAFNVNIIWLAGAALSFLLLPSHMAVFGMALAFSVAYWADLPVKMIWLRRRLNYRLARPLMREIKRASTICAALSIAVGAPGWWAILTLDPPSWGALALGATQLVVLASVYSIFVHRSQISPFALLRWLRS